MRTPTTRSAGAALVAAFVCTACAPRVTPPDPFGGKPPAPTATPTAIVFVPTATPPPTARPTPEVSLETPCTVAEPAPPTGPQKHVIRFLDIGQGDSALIKTASGKTVLIDAGDRDAGPVVLRELAAAGVTRLDLLVASHPHLDHIGGMAAVLDKMPVRLYVDPGTSHTTDAYRDLLAKLKEKKVPYQVMRAGKSLKLGEEATLRVLLPGETLLKSDRSDENANSLVLRLTIGTFDVLFTGDSEPETLDALMPEITPGIEILKVAHHGSRYGTNARFLRAVEPKAATISLSARNDYGHPHPQTLSLLREDCVPTFRTDRDGTIVVTTDGAGWHVSTSAGVAKLSTAIPSSSGGPAIRESTTARAPAVAGPVFASRRGKVYHPAGCAHLGRIKPENLVEYPNAEEAEQAGLRAGSGCKAGAE